MKRLHVISLAILLAAASLRAGAQDTTPPPSDSTTPATPASPDSSMQMPAGAQSGGDGGNPIDLPITTDQALLFPQGANQIIQPGDLIAINIFGESALTPAVRVDSSGNVDLPYLHTVHLAGLNIVQAQQYIAQKLIEAEIFTDPQVTIAITEGVTTNAAFIGEMKGRVPIYGSRRLLDVLAYAGGIPSTASHTLIISRRGLAQPIVVDLGVNPILSPSGQMLVLPGDVISVQKAGVIYVLGQFKSDGVYPLSGSEKTTLIQLAAKLGDPNFQAKPHELRLIRTTNGQRHFVVVDYKGIVEGKKPDPILQAGDILYMPTNAFKAAITSGGLSAGLGLVSIALLAYQLTHN